MDTGSLYRTASLSSFSLSRRCVLVRRLFRLSSFTNTVARPLSREEDAAVWSIPLTVENSNHGLRCVEIPLAEQEQWNSTSAQSVPS